MEANLPSRRTFPYSNWGAGAAVLGVVLALLGGFVLATPIVFIDNPGDGDLSTGASVIAQLATASAFLLVPFLIVRSRAGSVREIAGRLGLRRFRPAAFLWMVVAVVAYFVCAALYVAIAGEPEQEDIAEAFGSVPIQILLIAIAAPISEEVCFRGFLFAGLRERFPRLVAALLSGIVFGALHAVTGLSAVPMLIAFGVILALLYEKTGSIVPGILLHALNNSAALLAQ